MNFTIDDVNILYEDNHVIVAVKPQNMPSVPDESGDADMYTVLKEYIKQKENKPGDAFLGVVHRLDRPTGGVMMFAKTSKAAERLTRAVKEREVEKKYLAVLNGTPNPESGTLVNYLKKNTVNNMVYLCTQATDGAKMASLEYRILQKDERLSLAEVRLHTGRSHQIRVQMAGIAHPVYGDMRYGGERAQKGKLALWAYSLTFTHPVTKERMKFICEPPEDEMPWNRFDVVSVLRPQ